MFYIAIYGQPIQISVRVCVSENGFYSQKIHACGYKAEISWSVTECKQQQLYGLVRHSHNFKYAFVGGYNAV